MSVRQLIRVSYLMIVCGATCLGAGPLTSTSTVQRSESITPDWSWFEENRGQFPEEVRFTSWQEGYSVQLMDDRARIWVKDCDAETGGCTPRRFDIRFCPPIDAPRPKGEGLLPGKVNYLTGNDRKQWKSAIPTFAAVAYDGVFPGVGVEFHFREGVAEFDLVVSPDASLREFEFLVEGADGLSITERGDLQVQLGNQTFLLNAPVAFQAGLEIPSRFVLGEGNSVILSASPFSSDLAYRIDPKLNYSLMFGGEGGAVGFSAGHDDDGNIYLAGTTASQGVFGQGYPGVDLGGRNFVMKLDPSGTQMLYLTRLGGTGGYEDLRSVGVDGSGFVTLSGVTSTTNFPTVSALSDQLSGWSDGWVARLAQNGEQLVFSTYFGGASSETLDAIAVDGSGNIILGGYSTSWDDPATAENEGIPLMNPYQNSIREGSNGWDAILVKLSPGGSLLYSTYIGGTKSEGIEDIDVDAQGNIYATGSTWSEDFPVTGFQTSKTGIYEACFAFKISPGGSGPSFSSYFGGSQDEFCHAIAADGSGGFYLAGGSASPDFQTTDNAFQKVRQSGMDGFLARIDPGSTTKMPFSTFLGGSRDDRVTDVTVDPNGNVYLTGVTGSGDFPLVDAFRSRSGAHVYTGFPSEVPWTPRGLEDRQVNDLAFQGSSLWAGTNDGIFRWNDGGTTWDQVNSGLPEGYEGRSIKAVVANSAGLFAGTYAKGVFHYQGTPGQWVEANSGNPGLYTQVLAGAGSQLYLIADYGQIYRYSGEAWGETGYKAFMTGEGLTSYANMLGVSADGGTVFAASSTNLYKGTDSGANWTDLSDGTGIPAGGHISTVYVAPFNSSWVFLGTLRHGIYVSTDGGSSFFPGGLNQTGASIREMTYGPEGANLFVATSSGVWKGVANQKSTGSITWMPVNDGIGQGNLYAIASSDTLPGVAVGSWDSDDGFVCKVRPGDWELEYSTLLGGSGEDRPTSIAMSGEGAVLIGGTTQSAGGIGGEPPAEGMSAPLAFIAQIVEETTKPGDSNADGKLDVGDMVSILVAILNPESATSASDCNGDSIVNVKDLVCIYRKVAEQP